MVYRMLVFKVFCPSRAASVLNVNELLYIVKHIYPFYYLLAMSLIYVTYYILST